MAEKDALLSDVKRQLKEISADLKNIKEERDRLEETNSRLAEEQNKVTHGIDTDRDENISRITEQLEEATSKIEQIVQEKKRLFEDNERLVNEISEKMQKIKSCEQQLKEKDTELDGIQQEKQDLAIANNKLTNDLRQQADKTTADRDERLISLTRQLESVEAELQKTMEEKSLLVEEGVKLQENLKHAVEKAAESDAVKRRISELENELESSRGEAQRLSGELRTAERIQQSTNNEALEIESLRDKARLVDELRREISSRDAIIEALKAEAEEMGTRATTAEQQITALNEKNNLLRKREENASAEEREQDRKLASVEEEKQRMQRYVKDLGREFSAFRATVCMDIGKQREQLMTFAEGQRAAASTVIEGITMQLTRADSRNSELIGEMNEMNKEILKRGERLSALEAECEALRNKLDVKEKERAQMLEQNKASMEHVAELETTLGHSSERERSNETAIARLKEEIASLRSELENKAREMQALEKRHDRSSAGTLDDTQSEVMSTSTISKAEESSRMLDIENSFEERYQKLKVLAIKLKKKCLDQEGKIKEQEAKLKELQQQRQAQAPTVQATGGKDKMSTLLQNFNTLQEQYDKQADEIDEQKKLISAQKKDLEHSITENVSLKEKMTSIESELASWKSNYSDSLREVESLRKEKTELESETKLKESKLQALSAERAKMQNSTEEMSRRLSDLHGVDQRHSLLDMELETAERRIEELSRQCSELHEAVDVARVEKEQDAALKDNAERMIKDLEHSLAKEAERADEFKVRNVHASYFKLI
jgi:chromosome segregation ATPase